jgi:hypothetical protein
MSYPPLLVKVSQSRTSCRFRRPAWREGPTTRNWSLDRKVRQGRSGLRRSPHQVMGSGFSDDREAKPLIEFACRIDFEDLKADRDPKLSCLPEECPDNRCSQALLLSVWKELQIRQDQCSGFLLHRKGANIATIDDHNLHVRRLEALAKEGLLHHFVPAPRRLCWRKTGIVKW